MQKDKLFYFLVLPGSLLLIVTVVFIGIVAANELKQRNYIGMDLEKERTINVSGEGTVLAKPDIAIIDFSILNEAETADKAMEENSSKTNKVIGFLKNQDIKESDLKTTGVNVSPRYEYRTAIKDHPSGERVLVGYQARQSLEVKIKDLKEVGLIIEGAINAGANQVSNLIFDIEDRDILESEARKKAIKNAHEKANELANDLGVKLEKIISYNESGRVPYLARDFSKTIMESAEMQEKIPEMEVEPGENEIKVNVNIGYEIQY